jgi:NAD(P)-dependent dehydrogenase (short-subunit alcohol dehydrogenase family)
MSIRSRLKRATLSFLRELSATEVPLPQGKGIAPVIPQEQEPSVVMDNKLLAGKNVLITGAGKNIGRSIAHEMAEQGANIFFTDIDNERCKNVENELKQKEVNVRGFHIDCSDINELDKLITTLKNEKLRIDVLVNNVGIQSEIKPFKDIHLEEWRKIFDTNVFGPGYLTRHIAQTMVEKNICGSIIFITSIHQWTVLGLSNYSTSKAALGMLVKELAIEYAQYKIRVNGIAPGWTTEDDSGNPLYHESTPLYKSSINPLYIGRAAVYLASNYFSKFTTGSIIKIDAGLSLHNYFTRFLYPID